jgi:hypothetical protein
MTSSISTPTQYLKSLEDAPEPGSMLVAPEHTTMANILETVLVDHNRNQIRIDFQCGNKRVGELFDDPAFLFSVPAFAHFKNNDGHDFTFLLRKYRADRYLAAFQDPEFSRTVNQRFCCVGS